VCFREVSRFHFVDSRKLVAVGSGFGGYLVTRLLAEDSRSLQPMLQCGVSTAPVVKWQQFNPYLSQRYLGLPSLEDNWEGYSSADLTKLVQGMADDKLFLVHGMMDQVVNISQSWQLSQTLVNDGVIFTQMFYPGADHHLQCVSHHYHSSLQSFLRDCLGENLHLTPRDVQYTASDSRED